MNNFFGDQVSISEGPYLFLYRWGVRHIVMEFIIFLVAISLVGAFPLGGYVVFICCLISIVGACIPVCFCLSYTGWKVNLNIQTLVTIARVVTFIIIVCQLKKHNSKFQVVIFYLICLVVSVLSTGPIIFYSRYYLNSHNTLPVESIHSSQIQVSPTLAMAQFSPSPTVVPAENIIQVYAYPVDKARRGSRVRDNPCDSGFVYAEVAVAPYDGKMDDDEESEERDGRSLSEEQPETALRPVEAPLVVVVQAY